MCTLAIYGIGTLLAGGEFQFSRCQTNLSQCVHIYVELRDAGLRLPDQGGKKNVWVLSGERNDFRDLRRSTKRFLSSANTGVFAG